MKMEELVRMYAEEIAEVIKTYRQAVDEARTQADRDYAPIEAFNEILDLLNVRR